MFGHLKENIRDCIIIIMSGKNVPGEKEKKDYELVRLGR